jgi:hypothetical protein
MYMARTVLRWGSERYNFARFESEDEIIYDYNDEDDDNDGIMIMTMIL